MHPCQHGRNSAHCVKQKGTVLALALFFLLIVTVYGLTAMQTAALELKMSGHEQRSYQLFLAADHGINQALRAAAAHPLALDPLNPDEIALALDGIDVRVTTRFEGWRKTVPAGYSLRGEFNARHFAVRSSASAAEGARAIHQQGFYVMAPGTK